MVTWGHEGKVNYSAPLDTKRQVVNVTPKEKD